MNRVLQIVVDAMLMAMYVALSFLVISMGSMKVTLEALPILVGSLLFGPIDGLIIGGLGSFLNQMLTFGVTATTILWILPHAASGLLVGLYAKYRGFRYSYRQMIFITVCSALLVTALNTFAMYLDSVIYGYFSVPYVFGALPFRIVAGIITAVAYTAVLPTVLKSVRHILKLNKDNAVGV